MLVLAAHLSELESFGIRAIVSDAFSHSGRLENDVRLNQESTVTPSEPNVSSKISQKVLFLKYFSDEHPQRHEYLSTKIVPL